MATRAEVIDALSRFAGPVGPFRSFDDFLREKDEWSADASLLEPLLDVAAEPPADAELEGATREDFEGELSEALARAARLDPERFLALAAGRLGDDAARPIVIEAVGALGDPRGTAVLSPLVGQPLSPADLVRLVDALGEIATPEARSLLAGLRERHAEADPELDRAFEIALRA